MDETTVSIHQTIISILSESKDYWPAVIGTAFGAVVGAAVSGWISRRLQKKNFDEARKMREEEKLERDRALGKAVFMKMIHFETVFFHMYSHFQKGVRLAEEARNSNISAYTEALANMPASENFTYEELGLLLGAKNDDLFNLIWSMNSRSRDLLNIVENFSARRIKLEEEVQPFIRSFEGTEVILQIPEDSKAKIQIKQNELNALIASIHPMAETGLRDATKVLADLDEVLNTILKLGIKLDWADRGSEQNPPQQTSG